MNNVPESTKDILEDIKQEVIWLHADWRIYRQLFGHSPERIKLLNACSRFLFFVFERVLREKVQLSFTKLTDPARSVGHDNLSLWQLQNRIEESSDLEFSTRLKEILEDLNIKCEVFRTRRNKQIAHLDLETAIQKGTNLSAVSRRHIEETLHLVREYMNTIDKYYYNSTTLYDNLLSLSRECMSSDKMGILGGRISGEFRPQMMVLGCFGLSPYAA